MLRVLKLGTIGPLRIDRFGVRTSGSDYLDVPPDRQEQYAAWMSGYFNAARNMPMVDLKRFATNKKLVEKYCKGHKKDNLMNVIRKVAI